MSKYLLPIDRSRVRPVRMALMLGFIVHFFVGGRASWADTAPETGVDVSWKSGAGEPRLLKHWGLSELRKLKAIKSRELNPNTGQWGQWQGPTLERVLEESMGPLSLEERAQVDLIVIESAIPNSKSADIPRAISVKYPLLLATENDALVSVVPWSTKEKLLTEVLPVERYFVSKVSRVVLTNYRVWYAGGFFVKRRTDPLVIRGEKRFVQACAGCHGWREPPSSSSLSQTLVGVRDGSLFQEIHGKVGRMPPFGEMDKFAIQSYLTALGTRAQ